MIRVYVNETEPQNATSDVTNQVKNAPAATSYQPQLTLEAGPSADGVRHTGTAGQLAPHDVVWSRDHVKGVRLRRI